MDAEEFSCLEGQERAQMDAKRIPLQKFRVSIFSTGSAKLVHDGVESAVSHLAVRQKYIDLGYAVHQLSIMRVVS